MQEHIIVQLVLILTLGIGAQWLGWKLGLPAILPLLIVGFVAGPVTGLLEPDATLGDVLFPLVSLSVALILLEGGLSLKFGELREVRGVVRRLITLGVLVTWGVGGLAAYFILGLDVQLSALLAAILVVSGPTVVIPLLRFIRPSERVGSVLKWEGIMVDPVGATLAVLVFGAIGEGNFAEITLLSIVTGIALTLLIGGVVGVLAGRLVTELIGRHQIPENLHTPAILVFALVSYAVSNAFRAEAGLMAVTVLGVVLANQKKFSVRSIVTFKEELGTILLSVLFIILSARLELSDFAGIGPEVLLFFAVLLLVARPLAVWVSTLGSSLPWNERLFLMTLAPRGIVAASVASLFALELSHTGVAGAEALVPLTFLVVVGSVTVSAFSAVPFARRLGVVQTPPEGMLLVGAHSWARDIARAVQDAGTDVLLVDMNPENVRAAEAAGLTAVQGNILSDAFIETLPTDKLGRMLALTSNDELNVLAATRLAEQFGRGNVYMLAAPTEGLSSAQRQLLLSRSLFGPDKGFRYLDERFRAGAVVKTADLLGDAADPLFLVGEGLEVVTAQTSGLKSGQRVIGLAI